jgi:IS1 family transposase
MLGFSHDVNKEYVSSEWDGEVTGQNFLIFLLRHGKKSRNLLASRWIQRNSLTGYRSFSAKEGSYLSDNKWKWSVVDYVKADSQLSTVVFPNVPRKSPLLNVYPLTQLYFLQDGASEHGFSRFSGFLGLPRDKTSRDSGDKHEPPIGPFEGCTEPLYAVLGCGGICLGFCLIYYGNGVWSVVCGICLIIFGSLTWLGKKTDCNQAENDSFHDGKSVTQKYLTTAYYCNTVIGMANVLNIDKQIAVIGALAEGSSIRSIERITGIHRDTIMRLGVKVGCGCANVLDAKMRDLPCRYLQLDEIWGFIGKKERHLRAGDDPQYGDVWTFCAIDAETKIVPAFKCGKRDLKTANAFVGDLAGRLRNRVQISSDALRAYVEAIEQNFGTEVDFGQIVKTYEHDHSQHPEHKYSAPKFVAVDKRAVMGSPDMDLVSTSYIERMNATTRLHMRRLTRLTLAFSKKLENFEAAVGLHFAYYNLVKRHNSLRCTPAMAAGIERDFWTVGNLIEAAI